MLLPDFAIDALLEGRRPEHETYETTVSGVYYPKQTFAESNASSQNIDVKNKPRSEWGGNQFRDQETKENDQAGQMAANVKLPPSSEPNTANPIDLSRSDIDKIMDRAITAALESMDSRETIISRRKGKELSLASARKRDQTCMETPPPHNSNPFDDPNYQWKAGDTPALIEYLENKFEVRIPTSPGESVTIIRRIKSNQSMDRPSMNVGSPLTAGSAQSQFEHERWSPRDGEALHSPNASPTTPQNVPDIVHILFSPTELKGERGFICTYECPFSEEMCATFLNGNDKRSQYRHAAIHAETEEELVVKGIIDLNDALVFTQLQKMVVKCDIEGCSFEAKVWTTADQVRECHELESHPTLIREDEC